MEVYIKDGDKLVPKPLKGSAPDGDGLYKLSVDTEIGDVSIENVLIGKVSQDSDLTVKLSDGSNAVLSVDKEGRLWIAGRDLMDAIVHAGDSRDVITFLNAAPDTTIDYIEWTSPKWNALLPSTTYTVKHQFNYVSARFTGKTPSLVIT